MYTIQANPSGTRSLEVSEENLATIEKYGLFRHLIDSNGIVDETVLDKLKLTSAPSSPRKRKTAKTCSTSVSTLSITTT